LLAVFDFPLDRYRITAFGFIDRHEVVHLSV